MNLEDVVRRPDVVHIVRKVEIRDGLHVAVEKERVCAQVVARSDLVSVPVALREIRPLSGTPDRKPSGKAAMRRGGPTCGTPVSPINQTWLGRLISVVRRLPSGNPLPLFVAYRMMLPSITP